MLYMQEEISYEMFKSKKCGSGNYLLHLRRQSQKLFSDNIKSKNILLRRNTREFLRIF